MLIFNLPKTQEEAIRLIQEKGDLAEIVTCDKNPEKKFYVEMTVCCRQKVCLDRFVPVQWKNTVSAN